VERHKIPELWDAETGLIQRKVKYSKTANGLSIDFIMDPLASRFVVFRNKSNGADDAALNHDLQFGFNNNLKKRTGKNETHNISYNWNVKFNPAMGGPEAYPLDSLVSWSEIANDGIKYYSGSATYERDFLLAPEVLVKGTKAYVLFNDIQEMARVSVNGNDCGIVWTPPYTINITPYLKAGHNKMSVQVINAWNNRIVGDIKNPSST
jgi:hypothetical protein